MSLLFLNENIKLSPPDFYSTGLYLLRQPFNLTTVTKKGERRKEKAKANAHTHPPTHHIVYGSFFWNILAKRC
jgi:hypothetical protein